MEHCNKILLFNVLMICFFVNRISLLKLIFYSIGISMVLTIIALNIYRITGVTINISKFTRRMVLLLGLILTVATLFNEVSSIILIIFVSLFVVIGAITEVGIREIKPNSTKEIV
ncbi:hypothetical protein EDC18_10854 [Natranaerovirga pectinivora]|uniref:Uncharacterized protein n=1 Tax=Natranaerovirga pectinivora TaxID=682400 RepID=A0A4R3MI78_9FIRM|nr:hypothetical protein [Natranaerovirga pectinivora]TCT13818.1 hypothetical protein EDC18_10854 [Natranaerovirga pectinivora]